ncbi:hypothetical protein Ahy_B04g073536 [Arachis hypogaea]|uniref:Uncharacterized protein n=1 Tax=Arachis hypogaea TaxID=3818 RepID=A0A444ZQT2_ARAHY|nr:hypothetical protein Ahy_B04g073536 [Arachis hypogaea]
MDSIDQEVDDRLVASRAQSRKRRKTTEYWTVKTIDSDGTIKPAKLSVREAMERPNGRRIMLRFNNEKQPVGDEAGLLSGVLGMLGSDYEKFSISEESWRHVTTKDKVYNECVKSEQEGRIVDRGELWIKVHKRRDGSYINDEARKIGSENSRSLESKFSNRGRTNWNPIHSKVFSALTSDKRLLEIEQQDESSRVLSQNDSIAQVFRREKLGRVRGVGFEPTPSQFFGTNLQPSINRVQVEEMQRKLNELQTELEAEKLKRKAMEDEAVAAKKRIKGEELPPEIAAGMCSME